MFDGIKNSFNNTVGNGKKITEEIVNMANEMKDMPYRKLKPIQIAYIIFGIIVFAIIAFVIIPMIN